MSNNNKIVAEAKALLADKNCKNCKFNLIHASWNAMNLEECGWWYHNDRGSKKSLNPPPVKEYGACKLWKHV